MKMMIPGSKSNWMTGWDGMGWMWMDEWIDRGLSLKGARPKND